jgi:hypothetical protein
MSRFKITEIQQYLGEKSRDALISMDEEADSLLKFIDKENKLLHKHFVHQDHQEQPSLIIQSTVLVCTHFQLMLKEGHLYTFWILSRTQLIVDSS